MTLSLELEPKPADSSRSFSDPINFSQGSYLSKDGIWLKSMNGHSIELVTEKDRAYIGLRKKGNEGLNDFAVSISNEGVLFQVVSKGVYYSFDAEKLVEKLGLTNGWSA